MAKLSFDEKYSNAGLVGITLLVVVYEFASLIDDTSAPASKFIWAIGPYIVAMFLVLALIGTARGKPLFRWELAVVGLPIIFLGFWGSLDASKVPGNALGWLSAHILAGLFLLLADRIKPIFVEISIQVLIFSSLASSLWGPKAFASDLRSAYSYGRLVGAMGHPNLTGLVAAVGVIWFIQGASRKPISLAASILLSALCLSLTSLVCVASGLIYIKVRSSTIRRGLLLTSLAVYLMPLIFVFLYHSAVDESLFTGRTGIWNWLASNIEPSIQGQGIGLFTLLSTTGDVIWAHAHNDLIMILVTTGFLGLALTMLFLLPMFLKIFTLPKKIGFLLVVFLLFGVTEIPSYLDFPLVRVTLFALLTIPVVGLVHLEREAATPTRF